jgi:hypothetical protein
MAMHAMVSDEETGDVRVVVSLLSPTLGVQKSEAVVAAAMARLGMVDGALTLEEVLAILDQVAREPGVVGVAARFARTRVDWNRSLGPLDRGSGPPSARPRRGPPPTLAVREIASRLANTVGMEKSREVVAESMQRLGLTAPQLDRDQASALLDDLARDDGLVGLTARFAKARLLIKLG